MISIGHFYWMVYQLVCFYFFCDCNIFICIGQSHMVWLVGMPFGVLCVSYGKLMCWFALDTEPFGVLSFSYMILCSFCYFWEYNMFISNVYLLWMFLWEYKMFICILHFHWMVCHFMCFFFIWKYNTYLHLHFTLSSDGVPVGVLFAIFGSITGSKALYILICMVCLF